MLDKIKQWFNGLKEKFIRKRKKVHKVDKRELYARILAAFMIFWTVASVFGFIGFARSCEKDRKVTAGAVSSNQYSTVPKYYAVIPVNTIFFTSPENGVLLSKTTFLTYCSLFLEPNSIYGFSKPLVLTFSIVNDSVSIGNEYQFSGMNVMHIESLAVDSSNRLYRFKVIEQFYLPLFGYANASETTVDISNSLLNINMVEFDSAGAPSYVHNSNFETLSDVVNIVSEPEYSFQEGYSVGYSVGEEAGYRKGLYEGVNNTDPYTFGGLLSAVIDVPIRAFTSLFNFEILGINLASFFFSLLTICIVLLIVKFVF